MKLKNIFLIGIILLAAVLRLWQLGNVPPSPDWDEAALGYNAYSILHTGKDEYGKFLPLILRSFDDYKPGLYAYFIVPFLPILGLTVQAVRMPSVVFGILTVLATYFLVLELFRKWEMRDRVALLSSFLLAISPWHIQFSRIAFESNIGLAFNIFALLFFLKGLKKAWYLPFSAALGAINIYIYQNEKVFSPLLFLLLIAVFWKQLWKVPKKVIGISLCIAIIVGIPFLISLFTEKAVLLRAQGTSVYSDQTQFLKRNALKLDYDQKNNIVLGNLFDNRRLEFVKAIASGYISHWDLNWLFITGDAPRHHAPFMGLLYLWELPFLFLGMYVLLFNNQIDNKSKWVVFLWFLIAPIPASITSGVPHAVRTLNFLPTFQIFTALGLVAAITTISNIKYSPFAKASGDKQIVNIKYFVFILLSLIFLFNFVYYLSQYFVQQNYYYSQEWQYGYKDAIAYTESVKNKYDKIVVANNAPLDQSYMFFLFYTQFPPDLYQKSGGTESGGFRETHKGFDKYTFRPIEWEKEVKSEKILYVGRPGDFPDGAKILKVIYYLDGAPGVKIVEG